MFAGLYRNARGFFPREVQEGAQIARFEGIMERFLKHDPAEVLNNRCSEAVVLKETLPGIDGCLGMRFLQRVDYRIESGPSPKLVLTARDAADIRYGRRAKY